MSRSVFLYGIFMAILFVLLKMVEYHFFARHLSLEVYLGIVAILFTALGIWLGLRLTRTAQKQQEPAPLNHATVSPEKDLDSLGISPREYEVLSLIAKGYTNQQIADTLFISLNTVKTHSSNLFAKLDVQRRTQAVHRARQLRVL